MDGKDLEVRAELMRLGVIVRDEKTRQYWRVAEPPGITPAE